MSVRSVFFDLGDTLVEPDPALREDIAHHIETIVERHVSAKDLKRAEREEWSSRRPGNFLWVRTDDDERRYWEEFYKAVLRRLRVSSPPPQLLHRLASAQMDPASFVLFSEVEEVLDVLQQRQIKLGIISNSFPSAERILRYSGLEKWFSQQYVIFSHQYRCAKPDARIYRAALRLVSGDPRYTLFVDDRPEFVRGALKMGIPSFWLNRNGYSVRGVEQIRTLREIIPLVSAP